jgi:hypothetical protein
MNAATETIIASMAQVAGERAQQILEVLDRVVPFEAASISVRDPERKARIALAAIGEVAALHACCESRQGDAELDLIGLNRPTRPLRHTDPPMPCRPRSASAGRSTCGRPASVVRSGSARSPRTAGTSGT